MRILPVLDLMHGQVVRGIAGRRESYRPIASELVAGSEPAAIAGALARTFRANEMYVADLDAIRGDEPAWSTYAELLQIGASLWIDAGVTDATRARRIADFNPRVSGIIAGLESLPNENVLSGLLQDIDPERLIFSLDLQQGRPLVNFDAWKNSTPIEIARYAIGAGVRRMIVLDLAGVGVGGGVPTLELCQKIRNEVPGLELTTGGGVRHVQDLTAISAAGCSAALVASAMHDGRISPADLQELGAEATF